MIIVLILLVAIVCAGLGMFYKEKIIKSLVKFCFKSLLSKDEQTWLLQNGKNYKTFSEARTGWFESGNPQADSEREKAEKWYSDFLKELETKLPAIPDNQR